MIRVALVDDHPTTLAGLATTLALAPGMVVVGTAGLAEAASLLFAATDPDVALVDIMLGDGPAGLTVLEEAVAAGRPAVILVSAHDTPYFHVRAVELGARGFVPKTAPPERFGAAIRAVASGETAFDHDVTEERRGLPPPPSERELAVIELLVDGRSNDEIGATLGISERTVESHLRRLYARYGISSRLELATVALENAWVAHSVRRGTRSPART